MLVFVAIMSCQFSSQASKPSSNNQTLKPSATSTAPVTNAQSPFKKEQIDVSSSNQSNQDQTVELENNRKLWRQSEIRNYDLRLKIVEGGLGLTDPVAVISVRGGKAISIAAANKKKRVNLYDYQDFATVEKLFELIEQRLNDANYKVSVKYDATFAHPQQIVTDWRRTPSDSRLEVQVLDLQKIKCDDGGNCNK